MSEVIIFYYSYELYDIFITVDTRPFKSAPNTGNKNINREFVSKKWRVFRGFHILQRHIAVRDGFVRKSL